MTIDLNSNLSQYGWDGSDDWLSSGQAYGADIDVDVAAYGADAGAIYQLIEKVCTPLHLYCRRAPSKPPFGYPYGRSLIVYYGPIDSESADPDDASPGAAVMVARSKHIPLVFLSRRGHKSDAVAFWEQWAFGDQLGRIEFSDPGDLAYAVHTALCEIFSQYRLALTAHSEGWRQNISEGLKSRQLAATLAAARLKGPLAVIDKDAWIQKQRELIAEGHAAVSRAKVLARSVLAPGYKLPIPIFEIVKKYGLIIAWDDPVTHLSGGITGSGGVGFIQLKREEPIARQRFSCAHELGHFVLGHTGSIGVGKAARDPHLSPDILYDPLELAANVFAAEVLLPEADVRQHVSAGDTLGRMTQVFGVSEAAMRKRLSELGF